MRNNQKQPVLMLENLSFDYHGQSALKNISLKINKGDQVVILGANGSGKSTLLKILAGLYFPTRGTIAAFGKILTPEYFRNEENFYDFRKKVGFVFQDPDVQLFSPTVWDEVTFAPLHMGFPKKEVIERAKEALEKLGIYHICQRNPFQLSGGEKKKVSLASILSYSPQVWLFDEPTAGLDPRSESVFLDFVLELKEKGNTVVTATHDLKIISEIAQKAVILSEDHLLVKEGTPAEILSDLRFLRKYNLAHEHRHKHEGKQHRHLHTHREEHEH